MNKKEFSPEPITTHPRVYSETVFYKQEAKPHLHYPEEKIDLGRLIIGILAIMHFILLIHSIFLLTSFNPLGIILLWWSIGFLLSFMAYLTSNTKRNFIRWLFEGSENGGDDC